MVQKLNASSFILIILILSVFSCKPRSKENLTYSPDGQITLHVDLNVQGQLFYDVKFSGQTVIDTSHMGFEFIDQAPLSGNLEIKNVQNRSYDETWEMQWGEQKSVRNNYNEVVFNISEKEEPHRNMDVIFRVFNDAVAFRYVFRSQEGVDSLKISDENTEFNLTGDHTCYWIPGDWDIYEHLYNTTKLSEIDAISKRNHPNLAQTHIPENAVNTPITMRAENGIHIAIHEADLTDYAGMTLKLNEDKKGFISELVGSDISGYKVKRALPFETPWRMILITDNAPDLIASKTILNLNEPATADVTGWFKPMKYIGIWWEMHLGVSSWDMASGKHGATTENTKRYIDFAAENGIGGVLVEGWNTGWEHWIGFEDREGVFDFVTPYEDYDLPGIVEYAKEKGVQLIMHHETSAAPRTYDQQLDTAYALMENLGIHAVKTGYVGKIIPKGEYHHGQWMVNHYQRVVEKGLHSKVAVNAHEPIKATGKRRTYPNEIAREGLRGQEFNAWASDGGNPPEHLSIVAFTRILAGPIDFTPGVFDMKLNPYKPDNQINTTLAQQLALYVVIYSPIQMACDLPQHYENRPAFQFIRDVAVDWDETRVLNGEVGDYVTIARKERSGDRWFLGSITDENEREITINFDFLDEGETYKGIVYRDAEDSHWDDNPESIEIEEMEITRNDTMTFRLAPGGGLAISMVLGD